MASTYTDLGLEQQADGENSGTWGQKLNTKDLLIEEAIAGYDSTIDLSSASATLTFSNGSTSTVRHMILHVEGTLTANRTITVPDIAKVWVIHNDTSEAYTVTVKTSAGSGYEVAQGARAILYCDGSEVYLAQSNLESFSFALSDETTALTTGTAKITWRTPYAIKMVGLPTASVNTAPTGSVITVDMNESGSTILSTKLTIDVGEKTSVTAATPAVVSDSSLAADAEITFDIDGIGSTVAGTGLKVSFVGYRV